MAFKSNAEQLNIEINLIATNVHQSIAKLSKETADYTTLVEQAQAGIQSMMDKTGMSATSAMAQLRDVNKAIISMRTVMGEAGMSLTGLPQPINPTILSSALRDAEAQRKGGLSTISAEIQAENKLYDTQLKRSLLDEKQTDQMVEKVLQKRAELQIDEAALAFAKQKSLELEKQLQLQTGMNAQQRAITAARTPLADVDMRKAVSENVMFDVSKFVGTNGLTPQLTAITAAMNQIKASNPSVTFDEIGNSMKKAGVNAQTVAQGVEKLEPASKRAGQGFNFLRSAMGFMVAMGMSAFIQGLISLFGKMVDSVKQAELAIFNLIGAEKALSRAGVEVTPQDFREIIDAVRATGIAISNIDLQKLVANMAAGTKDLKLSVQQMRDLSVATAVIAFREGKTIEDIQAQLQTGITTSGRGLKDLDIQVDAAIIKQKAVEAGLVKSAEAYDALTAAQKQQIEVASIILLINDNVATSQEDLATMNGTVTASTRELAAIWEDFLTLTGKLNKSGLNIWIDILITGTKLLTIVVYGAAKAVGVLGAILIAQKLYWSGAIKGVEEYRRVLKQAYQDIQESLIPSNGLFPDTPTSPTVVAPVVDQNLLDAQAEFNQAILDAELKLGQDLEDAKIDYERKLYDIDVEYKAKRLDLENDYAKKVADINRSYQDKIAEINQRQQEDKAKQRNDELQREREFQNQMLVLKENFLMALDDALHARDARQILKLIKNYELDKAQAERKNELDKQSAKEDAELRQKSYNEDRKKAEADCKAKLAEAQRDYADKIAKLNADEAAEREAARLANERKIEDLHREMHDRYEIIAAGLVDEYKLTEDNLKGIVGLYLKYYNNATQILAAMRAQLAGTMGMMAQAQTMAMSARSYSYPSPSSGGTGGSGSQNGIPMANGGTIIANKPTTVTFGERGLEAGTFMPLGRVGKDVNSLFSNVSGAGDGSGKVSIELLLSPDLESRIVSNTLSKTAEVFTRTQRAKR